MTLRKSLPESSPDLFNKYGALSREELAFIEKIQDTDETNDFSDTETHPFALHNTLLRKYGPSWLDWLPSTLWKTIADDFGAYNIEDPTVGGIPRAVKDKILALQVIHTTNRPWVEFEVFENVGQALNGDPPNTSVLEPLSPGEALLAMNMLRVFREDEEYAPEVLIYVASIFCLAGIMYVGDSPAIQQVQPHLERMVKDTTSTARLERLWKVVWKNRADLNDSSFAEYDPDQVQMRKLLEVYQYAEANDGLA